MKTFGVFTLCVSSCVLISVGVICMVSKIRFEQNCKGYLKHAADANTVQLAKSELKKSLEFIENQGLTQGSTHAIYSTPKCDLEFWYSNLNAAAHELDALPDNADPLIVSNQLMKLRETLVDQGEKGPKVTLPPYISVYPYQTPIQLTTFASLGGLFVGSMAIASVCESQSKEK